jgi:hypothetical protein
MLVRVRALASLWVCALAGAWLLAAPVTQAAAGEPCPNEARRVEQNATHLPDCRAYERVSPEEKGGGDIVGDGGTTIAATGGGAVAFNTRTPFGDTVGSGVSGQTQYVARRAADAGWSSHAVTPRSQPEALQTIFTSTKTELFSDDLRSALVWGYDLPGAETSPPRMNIYLEDTQTHAVQALAVPQTEAQLAPLEFLNIEYAGISDDAQHTAFVTSTQLLSTAVEGVSNVYQSDRGVLSLAGILPNGSVPAGGSYAATVNGGAMSQAFGGYRGAMSADGSRLLFTGLPAENPQLYMRVDGERTTWVSEPEHGEKFEPSGVQVQYMTPDGNNVLFVTNSKLLSEDENEGPDLYRWTSGLDPEHERNLTLITNTGAFSLDGQKFGVVGASEDGSRVYYQTQGNELLVWDNGVTTLISSSVVSSATPNFSLAATAVGPGLARMSPDGKWLAFSSQATLGNDRLHALTGQLVNPGEEESHQYFEMYMYSLTDSKLTCISCPLGLAKGSAFVAPFGGGAFHFAAESETTHGTPELFDIGIRPQFLDERGQVFFSTASALLPQDVNGVADVYEYDGRSGALSLLSSGTGSSPTTFADASANGEDVFVQTRGQLLSEDHDSLVDLYDVRAGGGFPAPPSAGASCVADECQAQPSSPPDFAGPSTVSFAGAGNLSGTTVKPSAKAPTNARRLGGALRVCRRKRDRAHRKRCEARARKRYGKKSSRGSK